MAVLHSHSRVGGNNRAHFEPETIYIVTVGSVPSDYFSVEVEHIHIYMYSGVAKDRHSLPRRSWMCSPLWLLWIMLEMFTGYCGSPRLR